MNSPNGALNNHVAAITAPSTIETLATSLCLTNEWSTCLLLKVFLEK